MIDAANPFVFVHAASLGLRGDETADQLSSVTPLIQLIRAHASVAMGISSTLAEAMTLQGCPKIAVVAPPQTFVSTAGQAFDATQLDITSRAYSMGLPHPNLQMTGAVCLAAAASISGTIPHEIVKAARSRVITTTAVEQSPQATHMDGSALPFSKLVIGHLGGTIMADSDIVRNPLLPGGVDIKSGSVYRTARRLMEGKVYYHAPTTSPELAVTSAHLSFKQSTNLLAPIDMEVHAVLAQ
jgi:2-methylaconitate cis-trans-isomerase PrpF